MKKFIPLILFFAITISLMSCSMDGDYLLYKPSKSKKENLQTKCTDDVDESIYRLEKQQDLFESDLNEFIEWKNIYDNKWNVFYYNLSNMQINTFNQYNKYKNKESYTKLEKSLTPEQFEQYDHLQFELTQLEKEKLDLTKSAIKIDSEIDSLSDMLNMCQSLLASEHGQSLRQDQFAYHMMDQFRQFGQDAQQRSFQMRLLNTLKGIESGK